MENEDFRLDEESEQSMDASDPSSLVQPGLTTEPVPSSTAPVHAFDCGSEEQYPEEQTWFSRLFWRVLTWIFSLFNRRID